MKIREDLMGLSLFILQISLLSLAFLSAEWAEHVDNIVHRLLVVYGITLPIYVKTGVPNMLRHECPECGALTDSAVLRCEDCGRSGSSVWRGYPEEVSWFLTGYPAVIIVYLPVVYFLSLTGYLPMQTSDFGSQFVTYMIYPITLPFAIVSLFMLSFTLFNMLYISKVALRILQKNGLRL